jgi:hypothetical protein
LSSGTTKEKMKLMEWLIWAFTEGIIAQYPAHTHSIRGGERTPMRAEPRRDRSSKERLRVLS